MLVCGCVRVHARACLCVREHESAGSARSDRALSAAAAADSVAPRRQYGSLELPRGEDHPALQPRRRQRDEGQGGGGDAAA